jgi:hypothetical protein
VPGYTFGPRPQCGGAWRPSQSRTVGLGQLSKRPGPTAIRPKQAWLCECGANALAAITVCSAPAMAWLPAVVDWRGAARFGGGAPATRGGGVGQGGRG